MSSDEKQNITLIRGINRSGKTSIIRAIRWALYGNTGEEVKYNNPKKFINTEAAKAGNHSASVELRLSHNNKNITITRQVKAKKGIQHPKDQDDFDHTVTFSRSNKPVPQEIIEREINKLLHEDISVFYIVDGEMLKSYEELIIDNTSQKAKKVRDAIERVIGKPDLINIREDLNLIENQLIKKLSKEASGNRKTALEELQSLMEGRNKKQKDLDLIQTDYDQAKEDTNEDKSNLNAVRSEAAGYKEIRDLEEDIRKENAGIEQDKDFIKAFSKNTTNLLLQRAMNEKKSLWVKENKKIEKQKDKDSSDTLVLNQLKKILDEEKCSVCGREHFNQKDFKQIKKQIMTLSEGNSKKPEVTEGLQNNLNYCNIIDKMAGDSGGEHLKQIMEKNESLIAHIESLTFLEADLRTAKNKNKSASKSEKEISDLEDAVYKGERNLGSLSRSVEDQTKVRDEAEKEYQRMNDYIEKNIPKDVDSSLEKKKTYVTKLRDAIGNIVEELLINVKDEISTVSNDLHKKMSHFETGLNLKIGEDYSLTTEFKNIALHDSSGGDELVTLSFIGGLKRATKQDGPLLIDSPFGRLDRGNISNVLKTLPDEATQLVLFIKDNELDDDQQTEINHKVGKDYTIEKNTDTSSDIEKTQ